MGKFGTVTEINEEKMTIVIASDTGFVVRASYNNVYSSQTKQGKTVNVPSMMKNIVVGSRVEFAEWEGKIKFIKLESVEPKQQVKKPVGTSNESDRLNAYLYCLTASATVFAGSDRSDNDSVLQLADEFFEGVVLRFNHLKRT